MDRHDVISNDSRTASAGVGDPNAPRCVRDGCFHRVQRGFGRTQGGRRGLRLVQGERWRWFCSVRCATRQRAEEGRYDTSKASHANRRKQERRTMLRLVEACKAAMDERGKVDPRDLVRVMMRELRKAYQRQYVTRRMVSMSTHEETA